MRIVVGALVLAGAGAAAVFALNRLGEAPLPAAEPSFRPTPQQVAQGEALARAGHCAGCHTARGGAPYAGGRAIETPFGSVYASNLTPDAATGLGGWTPASFWRALHHGRSKDGRLLYPAFPYPNYTLVTRADSDALFAYLQSLPAVEQPNRPHDLRFPYDTPAALAVWRALYFRPAGFEPDPARSAEWNRGAYLVRGLGHCSACHAQRNLLGATSERLELSGGRLPVQHWYAPSLNASDEAGVADWDVADVVALLKTGTSARGSVIGPMAEVVHGSTQFLPEADLRAMAAFLRTLPPSPPRPPREAPRRDEAAFALGARIYEAQCAGCHGKDGEGVPRIYPPLAGNRAVTLDSAANVIRIVSQGGYLPATAGNPRPHGMPPFVQTLDGTEIAAVVSYVRGAWGNRAAGVTPLEVLQGR